MKIFSSPSRFSSLSGFLEGAKVWSSSRIFSFAASVFVPKWEKHFHEMLPGVGDFLAFFFIVPGSVHHQESSHLFQAFPEDIRRENLHVKLSFASCSSKVMKFSANFPRERPKVGGFYTIWPMHVSGFSQRTFSLSIKLLLPPFPLQKTRGNKERNEREGKNKHKQKSHKRGTANETNHEAQTKRSSRERSKIELRKTNETKKKTGTEREKKDIPVKYANVNELICAILLVDKTRGKLSITQMGKNELKMINCN